MRQVALPLSSVDISALRAGEMILLSGPVYTARDAAHKRLVALLTEGKPLPFPLAGSTVYYVGPAPAERGCPVGPAGPTTSYRMDAYTPALLDAGLRGMIGKGPRGEAVAEAVRRNGAIYLAAVGGAAALLARRIAACEIVAFDDLGTEAIRRLELRDFPVIVALDSKGTSMMLDSPSFCSTHRCG